MTGKDNSKATRLVLQINMETLAFHALKDFIGKLGVAAFKMGAVAIAIAASGVSSLPAATVDGIAELKKKLSSPVRMDRAGAALEVSNISDPDPSLVDRLVVLLDDNEELVRTSAASALLQMGRRDIFEMRLREGASHQVQMEALLALRSNLDGMLDPELRREAERLHEEAWSLIHPPLQSPSPGDPIQNGVFDDSDFESDWILETTGEALADVYYDPEEGRTSPGSLLLERYTAEGELVLRSRRPLKVRRGQSPVVRYYYRSDDAPMGVIMQLFFEDSKGNRHLAVSDAVTMVAGTQTVVWNTPPGEWNKRATMAPVSNKDEKYHLVLVVSGNPATLWIDDFAAPAAPYGYRWPAGSFSQPEDWAESGVVVEEREGTATARVVKEDDQARLLVDGKEMPPILYLTHRINMGDYAAVEQIGGVRIIVPLLPITDIQDPRFEPRPPVWSKALEFDFEGIVKELDRVANDARESYLVLNLSFYWPGDWGDNNPDEIWRDAEGRRGYGNNIYFLGFSDELERDNYRWWPSPSSEKAIEDAALGIKQLVAVIRDKPYFNRIIGCFISGGHDQQFFTASWPDYSKPAQRAFREWLRERYGSDAALRTAWNQKNITIDRAEIPDYQALRQRLGSATALLDPSRDQAYADHQEFQAERGMVIRQRLADAFKEAMGQDVVALTWQMRGGRGQGAERLFLREDSLDMMVTQPAYNLRMPGQVGGLRAMLGSMAYHGKLSIKEMDLRTWIRPSGHELSALRLGAAMTPGEFDSIFRREAAQMLASGHGYWLYDIVPLHFRDPVIFETVADSVRAYEELVLENDHPLRPDVAVAWKDDTNYWFSDSMRAIPMLERLESHTPFHLNQAGFIHDALFLGDLLEIQQEQPYKLVIIGDAWRLSDRERKRVIEVLQGNGTTVVWNYAPGYLSDQGYSTEAIAELTGMRVREVQSPAFVSTRFVSEGDPASEGLVGHAGTGMTNMAINGPRLGVTNLGRNFMRFVIDDPEAVALARYEDGQTAIAIRRFDDWTSVYLGMPGTLDARLLNRLAREAGAAVLTDAGPGVAFNGKFLSIHATANEPVEIVLPEISSVQDFDSGEYVTRNSKTFTLELESGDTRWFKVTPEFSQTSTATVNNKSK